MTMLHRSWVHFSKLLVVTFSECVAGVHFSQVKRRARSTQQEEATAPTALTRDHSHSIADPQASTTLSSDLNYLVKATYRSAGNVLLGTTDIKAVASQACSSTDNLLDS